jgi:hypothetical protein
MPLQNWHDGDTSKERSDAIAKKKFAADAAEEQKKETAGEKRKRRQRISRCGVGKLIAIRKAIEEQGSAARIRAIEELFKIRDRDGRVRKFEANAVQRAFEATYGPKSIVLKARQMGITTWVSARFFLDVICNPGTLAVQVAHDARAAEQIFRIVHRFCLNLPTDMREGYLRTSRANKGQLVFRSLDSEFRVETAGDLDAGRGMTIQRLHCSEVGRWRNAEETLASLRAAVAPNGEIVLESTPQGTYGAFYREWREAKEAGYIQHFFPWWLEPSYSLDEPAQELTQEEEQLKALHGLSDEQIAFRRSLKKTHRRLTQQEFAEDAESCFLASGDCIFDVKAIDSRLPQLMHVDQDATVWEFMPALASKRYIIGVDACGGGSEGDFAAAQVIDENGMQCAELMARLTPEELAREVKRLALKYSNALVVVERNAHGLEVLTHLRRTDVHVYKDEHGAEGFETNRKTRPAVIAKLVEFAAEHIQAFQSRRLLQQMRTFIRKYNGRAEAASGEHDDTVMAMGIALYVRDEVSQDQRGKRVG